METNGAREEFFEQLLEQFEKFTTEPFKEGEDHYKGRILSITYDKVEELMKRVEELEKTIETVHKMSAYNTNHDEILYQLKEIHKITSIKV